MKSNFIILHRGALGDFLFTWPVLVALRWKYPEHKFIGLGKPGYLELAIQFGLLDEGLDSEAKDLLPFYMGESLPKKLLPMDMFLGWLDRDSRFTDLLEQSNLKNYCIHPPFPDKEKVHITDYHMRVLKKFNATRVENKNLYLPLATKVENKCLIHPGSGNAVKNFDPEFYVFVANELKNKNFPEISFLIGPGDQKVKENLNGGYNIIEPETVFELARTISGSRLFIGNDSGVSHLSGILGVRTIALYKSTNPTVWGTSGIRVENVEAPTEAQAMAKIQKIVAKNF